ncbi:protocadherin Fat 4 [Babesia caballi]|uniref:Protocadherin Fat 4 n=1 Tax=Babesia caballi TaxID=5871 RepID=A0AAV4LUR6_BABCB|nr:protocadherin Fat 4 [Babesia caballi]
MPRAPAPPSPAEIEGPRVGVRFQQRLVARASSHLCTVDGYGRSATTGTHMGQGVPYLFHGGLEVGLDSLHAQPHLSRDAGLPRDRSVLLPRHACRSGARGAGQLRRPFLARSARRPGPQLATREAALRAGDHAHRRRAARGVSGAPHVVHCAAVIVGLEGVLAGEQPLRIPVSLTRRVEAGPATSSCHIPAPIMLSAAFVRHVRWARRCRVSRRGGPADAHQRRGAAIAVHRVAVQPFDAAVRRAVGRRATSPRFLLASVAVHGTARRRRLRRGAFAVAARAAPPQSARFLREHRGIVAVDAAGRLGLPPRLDTVRHCSA